VVAGRCEKSAVPSHPVHVPAAILVFVTSSKGGRSSEMENSQATVHYHSCCHHHYGPLSSSPQIIGDEAVKHQEDQHFPAHGRLHPFMGIGPLAEHPGPCLTEQAAKDAGCPPPPPPTPVLACPHLYFY
jgi:hypothetical protein